MAAMTPITGPLVPPPAPSLRPSPRAHPRTVTIGFGLARIALPKERSENDAETGQGDGLGRETLISPPIGARHSGFGRSKSGVNAVRIVDVNIAPMPATALVAPDTYGVPSTAAPASPLPRAFLAATIAIGFAIVAGQYVPVRFDYTIAGAVLASLVLFSESVAWQTAITATVAAFGCDFLDDQTCSPPAGLDHPRRHNRRCRGSRRASSAAASHAPPGDLDRRGQRLPLSPAAVQRGT